MGEPVQWLPDGTPHSPRFHDIYRSSTGGLEQARHVFLAGCGLPQAWAGRAQWRILETGFGLGLNFLATWRAWQLDPQRPRMLHFCSIEAWPVGAADLLRGAAAHPEVAPLAQALAAQWTGLLPGLHRLAFEDGRVLLTLLVRDVGEALREAAFSADSVFLDGFDPQRNPAMWDAQALDGVARHCRRSTTLATWTVAGEVRRALADRGFALERVPGLPPKRECLRAVYQPAAEPGCLPAGQTPATPRRAAVIGAGLAGAAAAASLTRRGWQVTVLDRAGTPAAGASALPAGLLAPHHSPDDALLSRLSRCGVRMTLQYARDYLPEGDDWRFAGVLEHRPGSAMRSLAQAPEAALAWTRDAEPAHKAQAGLDAGQPAYWHELAAWIRPAALVQAWLGEARATWRGHSAVARLAPSGELWRLLDAEGGLLAEAELVVVAAAHGSSALLEGRVPLHPVRGQVSWDFQRPGQVLPPFPVNGQGHFIPGVTLEGRAAWLCGSTYGHNDADRSPRAVDQQANFDKLAGLLPQLAQQLAPAFRDGSVQAWTGVRCASPDRRPCVGELAPGLWVSAAMGSRGLTFAMLGAELLAARLHGEPLPLEPRLAAALDAARLGPGRPLA